ncbi:hypothetical protein D3C87_1769330 [compost metagenome]
MESSALVCFSSARTACNSSSASLLRPRAVTRSFSTSSTFELIASFLVCSCDISIEVAVCWLSSSLCRRFSFSSAKESSCFSPMTSLASVRACVSWCESEFLSCFFSSLRRVISRACASDSRREVSVKT